MDIEGAGTFARLSIRTEVECDDGETGDGELVPVNIGSPLWIGDRVYFTSDSCTAGCGNVFSTEVSAALAMSAAADSTGAKVAVELQQHTHHNDYYARHLASDGRTLVYSCGADVWALDVSQPDGAPPARVEFEFPGAFLELTEWYLDQEEVAESLSPRNIGIHPDRTHLAICVQGNVVELPAHKGPAIALQSERQVDKFVYLPDGRIMSVEMPSGDDLQGADSIVRLHTTPHAAAAAAALASKYKSGSSKAAVAGGAGAGSSSRTVEVLWGKHVPPKQKRGGAGRTERAKSGDVANLGIVNEMVAADGDEPRVALTNHRLELLIIDPRKSGAKWQCQVADTAPHESGIIDLGWSPCGRWLAYTKGTSHATSVICICDTDASSLPCREVTNGRFMDHSPAFDPDGNYLYFISARHFHQPVEDVVDTNYVTVDAEKIYALGLRATTLPPQFVTPALPGDELMSDSESESDSDDDNDESDCDVDDDDNSGDDGDDGRKRNKGKRHGSGGARSRVRRSSSSSSSSKGGGGGGKGGNGDDDRDDETTIQIDWPRLSSRLTCLAMPLGQYAQVIPLEGNCIMYLKCLSDEQTRAVLAAASDGGGDGGGGGGDEDDPNLATLIRFDAKTSKSSVLAENVVGEVVMSMDGLAMSLLVFEGEGECSLLFCTAGKKPHVEDEDDYDDEDDGGDPDPEGNSEVDLDRVTMRINPIERWGWVLDDAWRQFRGHFFDPNLSGIDWNTKRELYRALLPRVSCRYEFDVLLHEMLTELRASHTDEWGGADLSNPNPHLDDDRLGDLGVDVHWDTAEAGYIIDHIVVGDMWDLERRGSFTGQLGAEVSAGDAIVAVNHKPFSARWSLADALANTAGKEVLVAIRKGDPSRGGSRSNSGSGSGSGGGGGGGGGSKSKSSGRSSRSKSSSSEPVERGAGVGGKKAHAAGEDEGGKEAKKKKKKKKKAKKESGKGGRKPPADAVVVVVRVTVRDQETVQWARYRDWALENQRTVHAASDGAIGYIHTPDLEASGLGFFLREYMVESAKEALVIDLRWNEGGHVTELLIPRLAVSAIGHDVPRWGKLERFPTHAAPPSIVLLVDENSCSDADTFAYAIKVLKLGVVVGHRTWGGVTTMHSARLVDGSEISLPSTRWVPSATDAPQLENRGVQPDIEVEYPPHAYADGTDPQLARAVEEAQQMIA